MKKNSDRSSGCFTVIIIFLVIVSFNIYNGITDFFEERKQEELNGLYLDYIDSIRPTLEPKLFSIQDLEQTEFYKKYKDNFNTIISEGEYDNGRFAIDRGSGASVYLDFYGSSDYRFDIMEQEFPHYYLNSIKFEAKKSLANADKQFVADLLTTIGYPTTVKDLEHVGTSNLDDVHSQYIENVSNNACYQVDASYTLYKQELIDGKWENIYNFKRPFEFNCSFYPFTNVWNELEDIEDHF